MLSIRDVTGFIAGFTSGILIMRLFKRAEPIDSSTSPPLYMLNCPEFRRLGHTRLKTQLEALATARKAALEAAREAEAAAAYERG